MPLRPLYFLSIVMILLTAAIATAQLAPYPNIDNTLGRAGFRSTLSGTIRDMNDHVVSSARVEVHDVATGRIVATTFTLANGSYELRDIPAGQYDLVVTAGVSEVRSRIDFPSDGDTNLRIASDASLADRDAGNKNSVSLSQMKVPGNARKFFQKAVSAFRAARLDDAFTFVQKALGLYPDYAQALALRGVMNMQRGDNKKAEPDLQKAVELDYADDTGFAALAALYNSEGKFNDAQLILDRGLSVHPDSFQGLAELARTQIGKSQFDDALKTIVKAERYAPPDIAYLHLFRAQALAGKGDHEGAIAEVKTYLSKEPNGQNAEVAHKMLDRLGAAETSVPEARK